MVEARGRWTGALIVVTAASLFGMLGTLSRFAYDAGLTPFAWVAWRAAIGAIALVVVIVGRRGLRASLDGLRAASPTARRWLVLAMVAGAFLNLAIFVAFQRTTIALALLGFYTYPAMVAATSGLLGHERLDVTRRVALLLALGGMVAVVAGGLAPGTMTIDALGIGLALFAAACQTTFVVASRGYASIRTEEAMGSILVGSAVIAIVVSAMAVRRPATPGAALFRRPVRGRAAVVPVPDRHPRPRAGPGRHPDAVRAGRGRRPGRCGPRRGHHPAAGGRRRDDPARRRPGPAPGGRAARGSDARGRARRPCPGGTVSHTSVRGPESATAARPWDVVGPSGAPAIVFLHGAILSRTMWGPQLERLRDHYRCVTVDLPGHGVLADHEYTVAAGVEVVRAAIRDGAGGRAVVVGLSLGGYTAIATAAEDPDLVRGLVVAGASMEPAGLAQLAYLWYGWSLRLLPADLVRDVGVGLFRRAYGRAIGDAIALGYDSKAGGLAVCRLAGVRFRPRLLAYGGPILVVNGDLDPWFRLGERDFVEGVPNLRLLRLARASHVSNLDQPGRFSAAITEFEASLPA
jgi:pimeloyl-ACP methyl ester carboxylesterase/drug/metabolite transporter (DMT)-like permease